MNSNRLVELTKYLISHNSIHRRPFENLEVVVVAETMRKCEFAKIELTSVLKRYQLLEALDYFEFLPTHKFDQYIIGRTNIVTYIQYEPNTFTNLQEVELLTRIVCTQGDSKFAPMIIKSSPIDFNRNRRSNADVRTASFIW